MKNIIFAFILLFGFFRAESAPRALSPAEAQMRAGLLMQAQSEMLLVQTEISKKYQRQAQLKQQLTDLQGPKQLARSFALNSKLTLITHQEDALTAEKTQIEIDLKELQKRRDNLANQMKKLN